MTKRSDCKGLPLRGLCRTLSERWRFAPQSPTLNVMPPSPRVRRHEKRGRSPWYTFYVHGREHYLGTDAAEAHHRAGLILDGVMAPRAAVTVRGLALAWEDAGHKPWQMDRLATWAGEMLLSELVSLDGFAVELSRSLKPGSLREYLRAAIAALTWAHSQGWIASVPPMPGKLPRRTHAPRDVAPDRVAEIIATLQPQTARIVRFIVAVGCRPSEACRLMWEDIDLRTATASLSMHKTLRHGKTRTLYLTPDALEVLAEVPTRTGHVFLSRTGQPHTASGLRSTLQRYGLTGAYCLRHTAAQSWLEQGVDFGTVAGLLGHSGLGQVQIYAQVRSQRLREAARSLRGISSLATSQVPALLPATGEAQPPAVAT